MTEAAIALRGVDIGYDAGPVVHGVDLTIAPGELHVLLGPSGSGKTTILRAIAGFETIAAGALSIHGVCVDTGGRRGWVPPEKRDTGVVFQDYALFPHLDVAGNVGFGMRPRRAEAIAALLAQVGLTGYERRPVSDLSGGEQQRVALARALAQRPRIILFDEPFSNLNPDLRETLRGVTMAALREAEITGVFVTHDRREAFDIADRLSVIRAGRLLQTGPPRELYERPRSLAVARGVGEVSALPCEVEDRGGDLVATCALGEIPIRAAAPDATVVVIRPEQVCVAPAGAPGAAAVVRRVRYFGAADEIELAVAEQPVRACVAPGAVAEGDRVAVTIDGACAACAE